MSGFPEDIRLNREELEKSLDRRKDIEAVHVPQVASCSLTIRPERLPIKQADPERLLHSLSESYELDVDRSDIMKLLPPENHGIDDLRIITTLLANDMAVNFTNGMLRLKNRETVIRRLGFHSQGVSAEVVGNSDEALYLCNLLTLALWGSCNVNMAWEDIEQAVTMVSYNTVTLSTLEISMSEMFNPRLIEFLETDEAKSTTSQMGAVLFGEQDVNNSYNNNKCLVVPMYRELDIRFRRFNIETGYHEECAFVLIPDSNYLGNSGPITVRSELPFDKHVKFVDDLVNYLAER